MGNEALCRVEYDGAVAEAKVLLETEEIIVRGALKVRIPFRNIQSLTADGDILHLRWPGHEARLYVGAQAAKWAEKIRNPKSAISKIGVKAGQKVSIVGKLDDPLPAEIAAITDDVSTRLLKNSDVVFFAAEHRDELSRMGKLAESLAPAGALWVIRPKGTPDISDRDVIAAGRGAGLVDVKVVKVSERLTGEKFVIPVTRR